MYTEPPEKCPNRSHRPSSEHFLTSRKESTLITRGAFRETSETIESLDKTALVELRNTRDAPLPVISIPLLNSVFTRRTSGPKAHAMFARKTDAKNILETEKPLKKR